MQCLLCKNQVLYSGKVRPDVGTFRCGHEYHLSCIIEYCTQRHTNACPQCVPPASHTFANFSDDRFTALQTLIESRRHRRELKSDVGFLGNVSGWFGSSKTVTLSSLVNNGTSLNTLRVQGFLPEDFIEQKVTWSRLTKVYTMDTLLEFGFKWHHMVVMGFCPEDFKAFTWQQLYTQLKIRAPDMLKTSIDVRQLSELNYSIQNIKQLGFMFSDFLKMNGDVKTLRLLTSNLNDLKTYFSPSADDWCKAGFSTDKMKQNKWTSDDFTPVRQKRTLTLRSATNSLDF